METTADKVRALVFAIGLHVLCVLLMLVGVTWTQSSAPELAAGPVIDATLVDNSGVTWAPMPMPEQPAPEAEAPPPEAQPEPEPPAAPPVQPIEQQRPELATEAPQPIPQERVQIPDVREQERIRQQLAAEAEAQARAEQEEMRRQEQIDLTERQRQQEEAERRERLAREQREVEERLAEVRRQREAAEAQTQRETERLQQIADRERPAERPSPAQQDAGTQRTGQGGTDESLAAAYAAAITQSVERNWIRPETIRPGTPCTLNIRQIPGGEVIGVEFAGACPYDDLGRRSVEAAVLRAQPLPYTGFESVFRRDLRITFRAPEG